MKKLKSNDENCLGRIQILFLLFFSQFDGRRSSFLRHPPAHHHQQQPVVIMRPKVNRSHAKQSYFDRHVSTNINVSRQQFVVTVAMPYNIHNIHNPSTIYFRGRSGTTKNRQEAVTRTNAQTPTETKGARHLQMCLYVCLCVSVISMHT